MDDNQSSIIGEEDITLLITQTDGRSIKIPETGRSLKHSTTEPIPNEDTVGSDDQSRDYESNSSGPQRERAAPSD